MRTRLLFAFPLVIVLGWRLIGASGGGGFTLPPSSDFAVTASPEGGWTWFIDPRAVYDSVSDTTFWGYVNGDGDVTARSWDHATDTVNSLVGGNRLFAAMEIDDHDNPSVLIRDSDKRLMYFYSRHSGSQMYLSVSTNVRDISSFAARVDLDSQLGGTAYTYPSPVQLLSETNDPIYLFYRDPIDANTTAMRFSKSTNDGTTWAAQTLLYRDTNRSSYWKIASNGTDRIDFAVSDGHPMYDADVSIYHFYYTGGSYYKTDGTLIATSLPLSPSDLTLVHDGAAGDTGWVWDMALIGGVPHVAFATYPSTSDHRYHAARWTGSAWSANEVDAGGGYVPTAITTGGSQIEAYYSGGIVLDHSDADTVYASVGLGSGRWDIYRYTTADAGATWSGTALTGSGKNIRPVAVRNHPADLAVLWMTGTYASYTDYDAGTGGY